MRLFGYKEIVDLEKKGGSEINEMVFIDIETAGLKWWPHKMDETGIFIKMSPIIQIAAVAVDEDLCIQETMEVKIDFPSLHACPKALEINHFDGALWAKESRSEIEAVDMLKRFLIKHASVAKMSKNGNAYKVAMLAGHNVCGFDRLFLSSWFGTFNEFFPADYHVLDTMSLAFIYDQLRNGERTFKDYKLSTVARHLGFTPEKEHDAKEDVLTSLRIASEIFSNLSLKDQYGKVAKTTAE